jgi:hypothetical protein
MPPRQSPAAGVAGGFNAVQKLLTNPASRHVVKAGVLRRLMRGSGGWRMAADADIGIGPTSVTHLVRPTVTIPTIGGHDLGTSQDPYRLRTEAGH